jgi:hypothetical protein
MFDNSELIKKCGSWIRVQVAFYDFIFQKATEMCPECFKGKCLEEVAAGFKDGEFLYESAIKAIEGLFPTFRVAWNEFVKDSE